MTIRKSQVLFLNRFQNLLYLYPRFVYSVNGRTMDRPE